MQLFLVLCGYFRRFTLILFLRGLELKKCFWWNLDTVDLDTDQTGLEVWQLATGQTLDGNRLLNQVLHIFFCPFKKDNNTTFIIVINYIYLDIYISFLHKKYKKTQNKIIGIRVDPDSYALVP